MSKKAKVIVIRTAGTNCDYETVTAFELCGAEVDLVHINQLLRKEVDILNYQILAIPGGFSYGDDVASGKILANEIQYRLIDTISRFVSERRLIIGICNGFQVLVKTGLLPGIDGIDKKEYTTLFNNDSGKFEDRWCYLKSTSNRCIFTRGLKEQIYLPVAHGEGKFITLDEKTLEYLKKNDMIVFKYVNKDGDIAGYPANPNGSAEAIAGICNPGGNILGLMPHPERFVTRYNHPRWTREKLPEEGDGLALFRNAVEFAKKKLQ
ncbi:MAG: phosphoribosylformylglycinamidine synthase I [Candidatus Firestonebacteria bacterium]|nr:phosphoribosylformylglycinamidine synthase I [Candidatus Firestonebacteria bacterium]